MKKHRGQPDRRAVTRRSDEVTPAVQGPQPQFVARFQGTVFSGPLPHPDILVRYNDACPGAADRIIAMAERNQAHRQALEAKVIPARSRNETMGQIFGFVTAVIAIAGGTWLISIDKDAIGLGIIIGDLVGLVGLFLYADHRKRKDLEEKRK